MEVYALVGPSGSGKSHMAMIVARELEADAIIDDGLLICDTKIVAGRSAKRAVNRLGATKLALFYDDEVANEVRAKLTELNLSRVLILGTSVKMVDRITTRLGLPKAIKYISITDISDPSAVALAMRVRREYGRHVIPAPTFEVKKSFSGYLVNPLRLRLFRSGKVEGPVVEKSVVRPTYSSFGRFYITDTVVSAIAAKACQDVPGIAQVGKIEIINSTEGVSLNMEVVPMFGVNISETLKNAQIAVKQMVEHMTALNVLAVNLFARRLKAPQEISE